MNPGSTIILMPLNQPFTRLSDYYWETAKTLSKRNYKVYGYQSYQQAKNLRKIITKPTNLRLFIATSNPLIINTKPFHWLPFERFNRIYTLNRSLSFIFTLLLIKASNPEKNLILWIFHPQFYNLISLTKKIFPQAKIVYETPDLLTSTNKIEEKMIRLQENYLFTHADLVTTNCPGIYNYFKKTQPQIKLTQSGFKLDVFSTYNQPLSLSNKQIVIGYCGSINYRIDYDLLFKIFCNSPDWKLVLLGPIYQEKQDQTMSVEQKRQRLLNLPNVEWIPKVSSPHLPSHISSWNIGIIPYHPQLTINKYCNPTKLMEYFYMEVPVITTKLVGIYSFKKNLTIATTATEWKEAIKAILRNPPSIEQKKNNRHIAIANSWDNRVKTIENYLTQIS